MGIRGVVACVALAVLATGCDVRTTVAVRVGERGAGVVTVAVALDRDAVSRLTADAGSVRDAVRLDGLRDAGWRIGEWEADDDGGASITVRKPFVGADQLESVLGELAGPEVVEGVVLERDRGVVDDRDRLELAIDLRELATRIADDEELAANLRAAGLDPAAAGAAFDAELADSLRVDVVAAVPGSKEKLVLRPGERDVLVVESTRRNLDRMVLGGIGALAATLGVVLVTATTVSTVGHRRRLRAAESRAARVRRGRDDQPLM